VRQQRPPVDYLERRTMAKGKKRVKGLPTERADRAKLTAEESLKRLQEFTKRKEHFVAAVRKGKNRGVSARRRLGQVAGRAGR
jgi:hypothetical protein